MAFAIPAKYAQRARGVKAKTWLIVAGVAGIALYFIFSYKKTPQQKQYLQGAKNRLDELARNGIVPSLTNEMFSGMAAELLQAIANCGTDEGLIYDVFRALNNEADLMLLVISFDIGSYDGCFEGSLPRWRVHYTLAEALASDLNSYERSQVNSILSSKGINYRF